MKYYTLICMVLFLINIKAQAQYPIKIERNNTITPNDNSGTHIEEATNLTVNGGSVTGTSQTLHQASKLIHITGGANGIFHAGGFTNNSAKYNAKIILSPEVAAYSGSLNSSGQLEIGEYDKLEFGLQHNNQTIKDAINAFLAANPANPYASGTPGINPFDPTQISFEISCKSPIKIISTGNQAIPLIIIPSFTFTKYGFYYQNFYEDQSNNGWTPIQTDYDWRFRFAPFFTGQWEFGFSIIANGTTISTPFNVLVDVVESSNKGFLEVGEFKRQLRFSKDKESWFGIGCNTSFFNDPTYSNGLDLNAHHKQLASIEALGNSGGNLASVAMWRNVYTVEFEKLTNFKDHLDEMHALDEVIDLATLKGVYLKTSISGSIEYSSVFWPDNAYKNHLSLTDPVDFFASASAFEIYKKRLRYINARWGYSTNIAYYDVISEFIYEDESTYFNPFYDHYYYTNLWLHNVCDYLKNTLNDPHLKSTSTASVYLGPSDIINFNHLPFSDDLFDITLPHKYGLGRPVNFINRFDIADKYTSVFNKPSILDEVGSLDNVSENDEHSQFHNTLWSTAMSGYFGTGLNWWWDNYTNPYAGGIPSTLAGLKDAGQFSEFKALSSFFADVNFETDHFTPHRWCNGFDLWPFNDNSYGYRHSKESTIFQVNDNKSHVIGWAHNSTNYWYNIKPDTRRERHTLNNGTLEMDCSPAAYLAGDRIDDFDCSVTSFELDNNHIDDDEDYSSPISMYGHQIKITNLQIGHNYQIQWFATHGNGSPVFSIDAYYDYEKNTGANGIVSFDWPDATENDLAFKLTRSNSNRLANSDSTKTDSITQSKPKVSNNSNVTSNSIINIDSPFKIYPNPTSNSLFWTGISEEIIKLMVYDNYGRVVLEKEKGLSGLNISYLSDGIYSIKFVTTKKVYYERFSVIH